MEELSPRIKRLRSERRGMVALADKSRLIEIEFEGRAPTQYDAHFRCIGLKEAGGEIVETNSHACTILLEPTFPLSSPKVVWRTPIFHPNFKGESVCLGDHWFGGSSLAEITKELCKMVQYQAFNVGDPLNADAAVWVAGQAMSNPDRFPIDSRPAVEDDFKISASIRAR